MIRRHHPPESSLGPSTLRRFSSLRTQVLGKGLEKGIQGRLHYRVDTDRTKEEGREHHRPSTEGRGRCVGIGSLGTVLGGLSSP